MADRFETPEDKARRDARIAASRQPGARPAFTASQPVTPRQIIAMAFMDLQLVGGEQGLSPVQAGDGLAALREVVDYINTTPQLAPDRTYRRYDLTGLGEAGVGGTGLRIPWGLNVLTKAEYDALPDAEKAGIVPGIQDAPPVKIGKLWFNYSTLKMLTDSEFAEATIASTSDQYCCWYEESSPNDNLWFPGGLPETTLHAFLWQPICLPLSDVDALRTANDEKAIRLDLQPGYVTLLRTELCFQVASFYGKGGAVPPTVIQQNRRIKRRLRSRNFKYEFEGSPWEQDEVFAGQGTEAYAKWLSQGGAYW